MTCPGKGGLFVRGGRAASPIVVAAGPAAAAPVADLDDRPATEKQPIIVIDNYDSFTYNLCQIEMEYEGKCRKDQRLKCDYLVFDLDDTLYPMTSGIGADVMKNIQDYMVQKLGVEESISLELCILLYKQYGSTMAGLRAVGYQFDYDDYHRYLILPKFDVCCLPSAIRTLSHLRLSVPASSSPRAASP